MSTDCAPYGYDKWTHTEVIPKPPPVTWMWHIGLPTDRTGTPTPTGKTRAPGRLTITMQLTADQQVELSISGEDAYGNPVEITGDVQWSSSDESIVVVEATDPTNPNVATALAVGPAGTAAVTVTNDVDRDGTGDFMGSLAIDVVAGDLTEIVIEAGEPHDKNLVNPQE